MIPEARQARAAEIAEAGFAVLAECGVAGWTMIAVARRARASNETLYRWYGDKTGLLRAMVVQEAAAVAARVDAALIAGGAVEAVLARVGAVLLEAQAGPRWVALCRAAAGDGEGALGVEIDAAWRGWIVPRVVQVFVRLRAAGRLSEAPEEAATLWLEVLAGGEVLRAVLGLPRAPDVAARVARASALVLRGT